MTLVELRRKVDVIDGRLVKLLNERITTVRKIGNLKCSARAEIYVPAREKEVLCRVQSMNSGPMSNASLRAIYREIMSAALAVEKPVKVAYFGPANGCAHAAARSRFGASVKYVGCNSVEHVFSAVEQKKADYGVVALENTEKGQWAATVRCFRDSALKICAEILFSTGVRTASRSHCRFAVLARSFGLATGDDKTSVVFSVRKGGTVQGVLALLRTVGLKVILVQSASDRPVFCGDGSKRSGAASCCFVEVEGHADDKAVAAALEKLAGQCKVLRILGSYPKAALERG